MVDFKNVALNNDSDSEDEFVNIVVPLFEQDDSELTKSAVKEMLSRSTEPKKADKKLKGKRGMFSVLYPFLRAMFLRSKRQVFQWRCLVSSIKIHFESAENLFN